MFIANTYPIVCVLGDRGSGKTLTMTVLGDEYEKEGLSIFANYTLKGIPYKHIEFKDIVKFPPWLKNGVILLDEGHIGMDAYNFFSRQVKDITTFITQTRKRKLIILYSTQNFTSVAKRLRVMTNYILQCNKTDVLGITRLDVFDRSKHNDKGFLKTIYIDGRENFKNYDTNEIISE